MCQLHHWRDLARNWWPLRLSDAYSKRLSVGRNMNFNHLKSWVGRTESVIDLSTPAPLNGLAATLDHDVPPWQTQMVPPLGHWLYFLPQALQSDIAEDGHPNRGGFLPPVPLPRRMWAGSRISFHAPVMR